MDIAKLILTGPVLPPRPLDNLDAVLLCKKIAAEQLGKISEFSEEKKKLAPRFRGDKLAPAEAGGGLDPVRGSALAKDFESVLIYRLLDEMKDTIGDWSFEKDGVCKQVQGIFWLYLARDIASKGGFGLWKEIYDFLTNAERTNTTVESLNKNV